MTLIMSHFLPACSYSCLSILFTLVVLAAMVVIILFQSRASLNGTALRGLKTIVTELNRYVFFCVLPFAGAVYAFWGRRIATVITFNSLAIRAATFRLRG